MKPDGGPAFPHWDGPSGTCFNGMTLRDYFAAAALPAMITTWKESINEAECVQAAYEYADAMLAERDK